MPATRRRGRPRNLAANTEIVKAATDCFVRDGYTGTTMGEIAKRAGVAVQTIYSVFGSKLGVLAAAHDVAVARGDDEEPLGGSAWFEELARMGSAAQACAEAVPHVTESSIAVAPIYTVIASATADPDVGELAARLHDRRAAYSRRLAGALLAVPGAAKDPDLDRVSDILYATLCVETYTMFVVERGWSVEQWRAWAYDAVLAAIKSS